jgi:hypothetical protein
MDSRPWEHAPDLTSERLILIAQELAMIRYEARNDYYDSNKGDGEWGHGCRCYERSKNMLIKKNTEGVWPWFSVLPSGSLKCVLKIGNTLIRFLRSTSSKMQARIIEHLKKSKQYAFPFYIDDILQLNWYLVIETFHEDENIVIHCIGTSATGEILCNWEVPLKPYIPVLKMVNPPMSEAVDQPPPTVTIPTDKIEKKYEKG